MGEHFTDERARAEQSTEKSDEVEQTLEQQQDAEVAAAWRMYLLQLDDVPLRRPDSPDDDEEDEINPDSEDES